MPDTTKGSVVLAKPADWWLWIRYIENLAESRNIWVYVDPTGTSQEPTEPVEPELANFQATTVGQLIQNGRMDEWKETCRIYESKLRRYERYRTELSAMRETIMTSIPAEEHLKFRGSQSIRSILITLQESYKPDNLTRFHELNKDYEALCSPPKNKSIDRWFAEWKIFLTHADTCPDYYVNKMQALMQFFDAIEPILPMQVVVKKSTARNLSNDQINLSGIIIEFEQEYAAFKAKSTKPKGSIFGTFQGRSEGDGKSNSNNANNVNNGSRQKLKNDCICGSKHRFDSCPYVNPAVRQAGWTPNAAIQAQFDQPHAPSLQTALNHARRRANQPVPQQNIPQQGTQNAFTVHRTFSVPKSDYVLRDSWIADTGSDVHICNDLGRFEHLEDAPDGSEIRFGDRSTPILAFGRVTVHGTLPNGAPAILNLMEVAYVPGMHTNLVSMQKAKNAGIYVNGRLSQLENQKGEIVCELHSIHSQDVIEYNQVDDIDLPTFHHTFASERKSELPPHSTADAELWHARLAHASTAAVDHLTASAEGVSLPPCNHVNVSAKCETCRLAKAQRQISRRPIPPATKPWERVYFDYFSNSPTAYNGDRFCLHFICSATGWHIALTMPNTDQIRLIRAFKGLISWAHTQLGSAVKTFFSDNDRTIGLFARLFAEDEGIEIINSARYADSQHGKPERAGGMIIARARAMLIAARLPEELWPLAVQSATYLLNRTPAWTATTDGLHMWTTPHERMLSKKPNLANLRVFGCRAYVRDPKVPKGRKMAPRAWIGYLVGFVASNIWQIWHPRHQQVFSERDVIFDESLFYDPDLPLPKDLPVHLPPQKVETIQLPPAIQTADIAIAKANEAAIDQAFAEFDNDDGNQRSLPLIESHENSANSAPKQNNEPPTPERTPNTLSQGSPDRGYASQANDTPAMEIPGAFDALPATPESTHTEQPSHVEPFLLPTEDNEADTEDDPVGHQLSAELEQSSAPSEDTAGGESSAELSFENASHTQSGQRRNRPAQNRNQNTAQRANEVVSDVNESFILTEPRKRKRNAFAAIYQGFSLGMNKPINAPNSFTDSSAVLNGQMHRNDLPQEPANYRELVKHPCSKWFLDAMELELRTLESKGTWSVVQRPQDLFVIPTIWVYKYKFEDKGFLKQAKARLCVQGNKQILTHAETRAATLASRCFRTLMALTAAFGLDMKQFDALNAFVNSLLDELVYIEAPPGRLRPIGSESVLRLHRALYGLRRSPRLWQLELTNTLRQLGLEPINEEPCLFTGHGVIILVYVDDILLVYHPDRLKEAEGIAASLQEHYELRYEGEGDAFLGIKITRDRSKKSILLNNTDYIQKIISRFHMEDKFAPTPATFLQPLKPNEGDASSKEINHFQQKVGSINYAAIATRPDVAKIASHLASFMMNPGPEHLEAANRVLAYLNYTKQVGICYSANSEASECFLTSSDAAYGDHEDRHSSEGYLATLYGGPIDWRASKQKTVTTSSTEAELLAISEAGKTLQWWKRLFAAIDFIPGHDLSIRCDNMQTIRILCKDDPMIHTRLRHVDIHQHWLRQEVQTKRIQIDWIPTSHMPADGLTKVLVGQRFHNFIRLLGLTKAP